MDLALNNLQRLICHKNQATHQPFLLSIMIVAWTGAHYDFAVETISKHLNL